MAASGLDATEESQELDLLNISLSVWKGLTLSSCWNDFEPLPLDLHTAASIGCSSVVSDIISRRQDDLNRINVGGWTALMYASYIGHETIVRQLLHAGASVNVVNNRGQMSVCLAASCGNDNILQHLLEYGANIESCDLKGWTALFHASSSGHQNTVQFLIDQRANPNVVEPVYGLSALMEAAAAGHEIIVQCFLQHGANVFLKTRGGDTALSLAVINGHTRIANLLNSHMASLKARFTQPDISEGPLAFAELMKQMKSLRLARNNNNNSSCRTELETTPCVTAGDCSPRGVAATAADDDDDDETGFAQIGALTIKGSFGSECGGATAAAAQTCVMGGTQHSGHVTQTEFTSRDNCQQSPELRVLLAELGLEKYAVVFDEQDVDLPMFLTLNDDELKEVGIKLFGPRRKMLMAISRWNGQQSQQPQQQHSSLCPPVNTCQNSDELERVRSQLQQEKQLRAVTEVCLMEDRLSWQQVTTVATDTVQRCQHVQDLIHSVRFCCDELDRRVSRDAGSVINNDVRENTHQTVVDVIDSMFNIVTELTTNVTDISSNMDKIINRTYTWTS